MRNYQRSFRLEEDLREDIDSLPYGSINTLVNELLKTFFNDDDLRKKIQLNDSRFLNWQPKRLVAMNLPGMETKPKSTTPPPTPQPVPERHRISRLDDLMPGL